MEYSELDVFVVVVGGSGERDGMCCGARSRRVKSVRVTLTQPSKQSHVFAVENLLP